MRSLALCIALGFALSLSGCSGPSYLWIVNATAQNLEIMYASQQRVDFNNANASPWFWPWRSNPVLRPGAAYKITTYCYGCRASWTLRVRLDRCDMEFNVPGVPDNAYDRPDWRVITAYRDDAVQIGDDMRLYRIPAYGGDAVDVTRIPQPENYPVAAQNTCAATSHT